MKFPGVCNIKTENTLKIITLYNLYSQIQSNINNAIQKPSI